MRISDLIKGIGQPLGLRLGSFSHYDPIPFVVPRPYRDHPAVLDGPSISIVTPSYMQARFLEATIRSVLEQGYPRLEYIVMDGGSTDGTAEILRRVDPELSHWRSEPDGGQADAINKGFALSSGEVMAWLNSDDRLLPGTLNIIAAYFRDHPEVDVVYGNRVIIDSDGREVGRWVLPRHQPGAFVWADYLPQETMFWRRALWDRVGGLIDGELDYAIDWDLVIRFERAGARFVRLPRFLAAFTTHDHQKSIASKEGVGRQEFRRIRERYIRSRRASLAYRMSNYAYLGRAICYHWAYTLRLLSY